MGAPADLAASAGVVFLVTKKVCVFSFSFFNYLLRARGRDGIMDMSVNHPSTLPQIHHHFSPESLHVSSIGAQDTYLHLVRFGEMTFWVVLFFFSSSFPSTPFGLGTS